MANIESGLYVRTDKLGQFAKDVVDAKVLEGQCKGRYGWQEVSQDALLNRLNTAVWDKDYATIMVYATMLQAQVYNNVGSQPETSVPMQAPAPQQPTTL